MRKLDILTPIGIIAGILVFIFGVASNSGISGFTQFLDVPSMILVFGGVVAALMISFSTKELKQLFVVVKQSFNQDEDNLEELIDLFVHYSDRARREGLLALETELEQVEDPFIRKGIMLAIDGTDSDVIMDILNAEIVALEERHRRGRSILEKAGEYAPAWGMIGTLIGLVLMLNNLDDPASLGPNMAIAIITTLYGALLANLVFIPMASKLEMKTEKEVFTKEIIIEGVIGVQSGQNPNLLAEKLNAFISYSEKSREDEEL